MDRDSQYRASVVVPTFNRSELLRRCLQSALAQTVPVEIIVLDDGSVDDTPRVMREEFPGVRYERFEGSMGPSRLRNLGSGMATSPILFPIDDDAIFASPRTVEQTLLEFAHPRVGAVGIPFINVRRDDEVLQRGDEGPDFLVDHAYVGAAHALRKDIFVGTGGYKEQLYYMGEEGDYCLRMLQAGYVTRLGTADPMHHFESPSRNFSRADMYGRQNDVLFVWHNVPMPYAPIRLVATTLKGIGFGFKVGRVSHALRGLGMGYGLIPRQLKDRRPVSPALYRLFRRLKREGRVSFSEVERFLPPMKYG